MADNERLTPEEEDIRNQAMLQDLRYIHKNPDKAQSLERMRKRLLATEHTSPLNSMQASRQFTHKTKQRRMQFMHNVQLPIAQERTHYLNILIASVIAALLVGSLLIMVTHVYQNGTGGGSPTTPQISISKATPTATPEPAFSGDPGWRPVATFKGIGSTIIKKLHLKFPYAVLAIFTCMGKGDVQVRYDSLGTIGFGASCHAMAKGEMFEWNGKAYVLEMISVVVDKNSSWELQLANCVDKSACPNPVKPVTPTPAPTSFPTPVVSYPTPVVSYPTPTPVGSYPTPTSVVSYPTPTPVMSYPTPLPTSVGSYPTPTPTH